MADSEQIAAEYDILMEYGDSYEFDVIVKEDGNAIDFTNWSNETLTIYPLGSDSAENTYDTSGTLTTTAGGRVNVEFTESDTGAWGGLMEYELTADDSNGDRRTLIQGTIEDDG